MSLENTFSFKSLNLLAVRYLALILLGMPFAIWLLKSYPDFPIILIILMVLIPMGFGLGFFFNRIVLKEKIQLNDSFFISKHHGKVLFSEIYRLNSTWKLPQPNIIILLKNGRKIRLAAATNATGSRESKTLQTFIDSLNQSMIAWESNGSPGESESELQPDSDDSGFVTVNRGKTPVRKSKLLVIYAPLVLIISGVIIYFVVIRNNNALPKPLSGAAAQEVISLNEKVKGEAAQFIAEYQHEMGPFYLFTNDTAASLQYLPESLYYSFGDDPDSYLAEADSLKRIMEAPGNYAWNIAVKAGDFTYLTKRGTGPGTEQDSALIYFIILDQVDDSTGSGAPIADRIRYAASIPVGSGEPDLENWMKTDRSRGYGLNRALSALANSPGQTHFYFAARRGEGLMNEDIFRKWAIAIKKTMVKQGIGSDHFVMKVTE